jgi:hypothetical protein
MLHFDHGFVTSLYVHFYFVGDVCAQIVAILLVYVSILAFVDLIHGLPTRGGKYPIHVSKGSSASREEKLGEMHLFKGSLHLCIWELFFA